MQRLLVLEVASVRASGRHVSGPTVAGLLVVRERPDDHATTATGGMEVHIENASVMHALESHEKVVLELLAMQPVSFFPPMHRTTVGRLSEQGLLRRDGDCWFPTAVGLARIGQAVH